jgi:arsenite-transporting ATPase
MATTVFFLGKGGVGKSTSAALTSLFLAERGFKVLVVSLDPAHNQSDIFEKKLAAKPIKIAPRLSAIEIEQKSWVRHYLKDIQRQIKRTYSYLAAFNLENYFSVIKHSPGLEEYALILAFEQIREDFSQTDYIVFDMPPTALALKFFNLPSLSLVWIEHLLGLRRQIIEKREIITKIKLLGKEVERDKVLNKIEALRRQYQNLKSIFEDSVRTQILLVLNPDILSHAESVRIFRTLREIRIPVSSTIYNKRPTSADCARIDPIFDDIPRVDLPYCETPLIGIPNLRSYLQVHGGALARHFKLD